MNMPKSREVHAKIPSPKAIFVGFLLVTVKILNSYELILVRGKNMIENKSAAIMAEITKAAIGKK